MNHKTRLAERFASCRGNRRAAFVTFLTAGDPDLETATEILKGLPAAGADVIELGMPFSDPMADGPAIQASSQRALKAGQTMAKTLDMVRTFRQGDDETPIILMGYYNPIYRYPVDRFLTDAVEVGVDGLIVVDIPPEADDELCLPALKKGLNFIRLATPTTDDKRLPAVLANTSGFVYYVSITGITGTVARCLECRSACKSDQAGDGSTGCGRFWREDARAGASDRGHQRWCRRGLGSGQCPREHAWVGWRRKRAYRVASP